MTSSGGSGPLGTVYWTDEPERTRVVKRFCDRCRASLWAQDAPSVYSVHDVYIVSPSGIGHEAASYGDPVTLCGIKADGEDWWWREY